MNLERPEVDAVMVEFIPKDSGQGGGSDGVGGGSSEAVNDPVKPSAGDVMLAESGLKGFKKAAEKMAGIELQALEGDFIPKGTEYAAPLVAKYGQHLPDWAKALKDEFKEEIQFAVFFGTTLVAVFAEVRKAKREAREQAEEQQLQGAA